jgi:hypothetical protein
MKTPIFGRIMCLIALPDAGSSMASDRNSGIQLAMVARFRQWLIRGAESGMGLVEIESPHATLLEATHKILSES